jgi:hypothetical protein
VEHHAGDVPAAGPSGFAESVTDQDGTRICDAIDNPKIRRDARSSTKLRYRNPSQVLI